MTGLQLLPLIQTLIGHTLNSLPGGVLIALFTWAILRFLPRQNSGTRFAVWFVALLAVVALPLGGLPSIGFTGWNTRPLLGDARPLVTLARPWGVVLFLAWAFSASVAMVRLATGLWRLRAICRSCVVIDPGGLDPSTRKIIADCSSSRPVMVATSENVSMPAAIGFFKPMIVIPTWALRELSPEELNIVLLHEFAHVRRWDDWTNLLQKLVRCVFLFHPAVWWIESRLSIEREMACDDRVVAATANPHEYAKCLVGLLEKGFSHRGLAMAQAVVHRAREASLRLAQILDVNRANSRHVWKPALLLVGAFSLVCFTVVPHAPELVAFGGGTPEIHSADVHFPALSRPEITGATVIPAALHSGPSSSLVTTAHQPAPRVARKGIRSQAVQHPAVAPVVAGRWDNDILPGSVEFATASDQFVPQQAFLVVKTTQRVGQNSWVWSVSVWRITWTDPTQNARRPLANKT